MMMLVFVGAPGLYVNDGAFLSKVHLCSLSYWQGFLFFSGAQVTLAFFLPTVASSVSSGWGDLLL